MLLLTRLLLAALVVGLATPAAPPPERVSPPEAASPPLAAGAPAPSAHRHLSAAWSTLFSAGAPAAPAAQHGPHHRRRHHHHLHHHHDAKDHVDEELPAGECPSCGQRRARLEQSVSSADDLTALRIEFVKQQILKKLGLKEAPLVARPSPMPKPLALAGAALPPLREERSEDFYGRTDQVILFPTEDSALGDCPGTPEAPGSPGTRCFVFKLPGDIQSVDVTRADLWLYRRQPQDAPLPVNASVNVAEVVNWDLDASFQRRTPLSSEPVTDGEGWVKVDFARPVKYWFEYNELLKMVEASGADIATDGPHKPFIVISTNPVSQVRRPKRNARCVPGMEECCRDDLYVSFKEIGWDSWILQPPGYQAYFCRGSCTTAASLTITGSHHNAIIRKLMQKKFDLVPCCTPTKYSEISLLYVNNNSTFIQKTLPNMVVESCGCN